MVTFEEVADEIISKTINSIMFIDDELLEPFAGGEGTSFELSKGIYETFRSHNCSIDFYKFNDLEAWETSIDYTLNGRDMLILDWQLAKTVPEYMPTLKIISEAVKKQSLHFICLYTATETSEFANVIYKINAFFAPFKTEIIEQDAAAITKIIHEFTGDDTEKDIRKLVDEKSKATLKELVLYRDRFGEILGDFNRALKDQFGDGLDERIKKHFLQRVKDKAYPNLPHCYCGLGVYLNNETIGEDVGDFSKDIRNNIKGNFLIVNHTIILITNKDEIKPKDLYNKFKGAVINDSGNFLTLMGLEMRNLFKASSSFIGKDIDSINELAFFHHKDTSVPEEAFYDFLKELWKSQASSFLYDKTIQPKLFKTLEEYKGQRGINTKMVSFLAAPQEYQQHLGRLNYYYNILTTSRKDNDQLRFGDILRVHRVDNSPTDHYLLCITAHCDCLYSDEKINNMFFFVRGAKGNLENALRKGDTAFNSYIVNGGIVDVIEWSDKPFTIYIKPDHNNIDSPIAVGIADEQKRLMFHSTLKENYAQRIANSAFIYPLHVGIFFADTKTL
jgi:hypothetical protein